MCSAKSLSTFLILFGLTGVGKTYVGKVLAKRFGYHFWDADELLLPEMQVCIKQNQPFTQEMRDQFTQAIIKQVILLQKTYPKLVVAQALYKESNRLALKAQFKEAVFIHVQAEPKVVKERIITRNNAVNTAYAQQLSAHFEAPALPHISLPNNKAENLLIKLLQERLNHLL